MVEDSIQEKQRSTRKHWIWAWICIFCVVFGSVVMILFLPLFHKSKNNANVGNGSTVRIFNISYTVENANINLTFKNLTSLSIQIEDLIGSVPRGTFDVIALDENSMGLGCNSKSLNSSIGYVFVIRANYPTEYSCQTVSCIEQFYSSIYDELKTISLTSDNNVTVQMNLCSIVKVSTENYSYPHLTTDTTAYLTETFTTMAQTPTVKDSTTVAIESSNIETEENTSTVTTIESSTETITTLSTITESPSTTTESSSLETDESTSGSTAAQTEYPSETTATTTEALSTATEESISSSTTTQMESSTETITTLPTTTQSPSTTTESSSLATDESTSGSTAAQTEYSTETTITTTEALSTATEESTSSSTTTQMESSTETITTLPTTTKSTTTESSSTKTDVSTLSSTLTTLTSITSSSMSSSVTTSIYNPRYLYVLSETVQGIWDTVASGNSSSATPSLFGIGTYPVDRSPDNLFDNLSTTTYASRGNSPLLSNAIAGLNTGFYASVGPCPSVLEGFIIQTSDEATGRDPITITIEGSNSNYNKLNIGSSWTLIYNGSSGLNNNPGRQTDGLYQTVYNTNTYKNYRLLVTSKRGSKSDFVSYAETKFYGRYSQLSTSISRSSSSSLLNVIVPSIQAIWNTTAGRNSFTAVSGSSGYGTYAPDNPPSNLFDNSTSTRYVSRGNVLRGNSVNAGINTGFYLTVADCQAVLTGFSFFADANRSDRDPITVTVEGSNSADLTKGTSWDLLYSGPTGLKTTSRTSEGDRQTVNNSNSYLSYRFLVTGRRSDSTDYVSYSEVRLYGYHA